jgi:hypothetical protein
MRPAINFLFSILLWVSLSAPAAAETLSSKQIHKLLAGATVETTSPGGYPLSMKFTSNGLIEGEVDTGFSIEREEGKWWTEKTGLFCFEWQSWLRGERFCGFLGKDGDLLKHLEREGTSANRADWIIKK